MVGSIPASWQSGDRPGHGAVPAYGDLMDRTGAQAWLDDYVEAWRTYDPARIRALFADDVAYRYHPYDEPVMGADAVVASWLGESADDADASTRDAPDTYDAAYAPVAVDGDVVVARGTSSYRETPRGPVVKVYENCFLLRFDADGRCREFTEFYVRRPD
jgi:ketosteroid isomerase-like protein